MGAETPGKPERIRMDNGPELNAKIAQEWSAMNKIEFKFIQPGKPTQNAYVERFNGSFSRGVLNAHIFETIEDIREKTQKWSMDYNESRPHDASGGLPPRVYRIKK